MNWVHASMIFLIHLNDHLNIICSFSTRIVVINFPLRIEFHEKSTKDRKCSRTTVTHYSAARVSDIKYKINTCFGSIDFVEIFGSGIKKARGSCKS
jgi:hypothetical protein